MSDEVMSTDVAVIDFPAIVTCETRDQAECLVAFRRSLKVMEKQMLDEIQPHVDRAHKAWKALVATREEKMQPIKDADARANRLLTDYQLREAAAARAAQEAADKAAREDAARLARAEGDKRTAKAIEAGRVAVASVAVEQPKKLEGVSAPIERYSAEVVDIVALCKAVVSGAAPVGYIEANMSVINKTVAACKGKIAIPGVKVTVGYSCSRR